MLTKANNNGTFIINNNSSKVNIIKMLSRLDFHEYISLIRFSKNYNFQS